MAVTEFSVAGRRVLVVGAARSGVAAARLLVSRGARVTLTDVRPEIVEAASLRESGVDLQLGAHAPDIFSQTDLIVVSPGVATNQPVFDPARSAGVPIIGEIELASRWLRGRVIAITGTKGKSTTTTLTGKMLEAAGFDAPAGGNLGPPLSAQVDASTPETIHVVEASSFQLETTETFHPWIAALLNFSPDHLDRHAGVDEYAGAKGRIFTRQTASDWAVVNADSGPALEIASGAAARRLHFALDAPLDEGVVVAGGQIVRRTREGETPLVPLTAVRLLGRHLLSDVVAAAAIASVVGASAQAMTRAVAGFRGLEHALELVEEIGGVRFVNDSKATNIASARQAIESFDAGVVVILGGRFKGGDFGDLRAALAQRRSSVVAIGEARATIRDALSGSVPLEEAESLPDAVRAAFRRAPPGGVVLLAPACASFDMFRDYAERGRLFKAEVARLSEEVRRARES